MRSVSPFGTLVLVLSAILSFIPTSTSIPHFHRHRHGNRGRAIGHSDTAGILSPTNIYHVCSAFMSTATAGTCSTMSNQTHHIVLHPKPTASSEVKEQVYSSRSPPKDLTSTDHVFGPQPMSSEHFDPPRSSTIDFSKDSTGWKIEKVSGESHCCSSSSYKTFVSLPDTKKTLSSFESPFEAEKTPQAAPLSPEFSPELGPERDASKPVSLAVQKSGNLLTESSFSSKFNEASIISSSAQGLKVSTLVSSHVYADLEFSAPTAKPIAYSSSISSSSAKILVVTFAGSSSTSTSTNSSTSSSKSTATAYSDSMHQVFAPAPSIKYASHRSVPKVFGNKLHGSSTNEPSSQYVQWNNPPNEKLPANLLVPGVESTLTTEYGISPDTGVLKMNSTTKGLVTDLKGTPSMSRDGGKGGYLNGQKLFIFCDTGSYSGVTDNIAGSFLGFVSSSVAIDKGSNAKFGNPIVLEDGIAQWGDNNGRMRGFSPLTVGEQSYNLALQGAGHRYAIWPESSLILLNTSMAIIYAPIVYLNVDMNTKSYAYTYSGSTLLSITVQAQGGPRAERLVDKLFDQDEVEWGTIGGLRSWGPSGVGGNDGLVYVLGCVSKVGLLLGRVDVNKISDRNSYQYWTGETWSLAMPTTQGVSTFLSGAYTDGDMFYSPFHLTFIFVYLTPYADSTFYFRYLEADIDILPQTASSGQSTNDYVENIVKYKWSEQQVLYKASPGPTGKYAYAGGVQAGYFDADDITNGGSKMLISWTVPTGADPASKDSEYHLMTAEIDWA